MVYAHLPALLLSIFYSTSTIAGTSASDKCGPLLIAKKTHLPTLVQRLIWRTRGLRSDEAKVQLLRLGFSQYVAETLAQDLDLSQKILLHSNNRPLKVYRGVRTDLYSFDPMKGASIPTAFGGSHVDTNLSQPIMEAGSIFRGYALILELEVPRFMLRLIEMARIGRTEVSSDVDQSYGELGIPLGQVKSLAPLISRIGFVFPMDDAKSVDDIYWTRYREALEDENRAQVELNNAVEMFWQRQGALNPPADSFRAVRPEHQRMDFLEGVFDW